MGIGDVQYTVLEIVNEVQRKLGLNQTPSLVANKLAIELVDYINDVCVDLSDFGNWQEALISANVTAVSGQANYSISTSANVKNIADLYFLPRTGPMRAVTIDQMRMMTRVSSMGTPSQYTVFGVDTNGNPNIRVRPTPGASESGKLFSILYYAKTPKYTTSDTNTRVPFPGDLVVLGTLASQILGESGGAPTDRYSKVYQSYLESRKDSLNRFKGDTGWNVSFVPSMTGRRR